VGWVVIEGLRVAYGDTRVLSDVSLRIPRGSLVAVLGPSGCGKTTLLRAVAGLLPVSAGTITVGGRQVTGPGVQRAPEKRGMGWVPQDASLFPHLSVGENIGFGLPRTRQTDELYCEPGEVPRRAAGLFERFTRRGRAVRAPIRENVSVHAPPLTPVPLTSERRPENSRTSRITELATLVGLGELVDRAPAQLSGGQAQRVSLARALAPRPDLILLDEPFAALDPLLRSALRTEVAALLRGQHNTSLLVTHDQEEALSLADFVAVMRGGEILQFATPAEIYERPIDPWVASFVGDTVELGGAWHDGVVDCDLGRLPADWMGAEAAPPAGTSVRVLLRPEWVALTDGDTSAVTTAIAYAGHDALVSFELPTGVVVRARIAAPDLPRVGASVVLGVRQHALAYPRA